MVVKNKYIIVLFIIALIYLFYTKSLYLELNELVLIIIFSFAICIFFTRKILAAYISYYILALFDILIDFTSYGTKENVDGRIPPLFSEIIPESFDDYTIVNIIGPFLLGLLGRTIYNSRLNKLK
ncbi:MAG: hypothetical protein CVU90_10265 [Firmicutes bacterium HGW-Firmicutes-15]|nr:MAG: hypothetical protein CVU90_10265 [Firmicutes bacterium HGW-Firmicutes-15]